MLHLRKRPNLLGSSQSEGDVAILKNEDVGMGYTTSDSLWDEPSML